MKKFLLKHLAALKKVSMLFALCAFSTNMTAQILAESFEGPILKPGWQSEGYSDQARFILYSSEASHGDHCVRVGTQESHGQMSGSLSSPSIALIAGQTIQISFDYKVVDIDDNGGQMRIYVDESKNIYEVGYENFIHKSEFTAASAYTTVNLTFTAEETKEYYITFYVIAPGTVWPNDNTRFKFLMDKIIVENLPVCATPNNIIATETASNVVNLDWNVAGNETAWEVQVTNGDLPREGNWLQATESQKEVNVTPGQTCNAYVRSKCTGGGYSSFYGPEIFTMSCPEIIKAPYTVPFAAKDMPGCWQLSGDTNWKFSTGGDYAAKNAGDHTLFEGSTQYAWVDGTFNLSNKKAILLSPKVDISGLIVPAIEFYVYSGNNNNDVFNELLIEVSDGTTWQTIATNAANTNGWKFYSIDLADLNITATTQLRITVTGNTGNEETHYNDILVDDVSFREKTTCLPLSNFVTDIVTDVSAEISWDTGNNASTWDIAYIKYYDNFDGIANITGVDNIYVLNELESNTQYQIYIRSNCGDGIVGEWTGPYYLKTDCSVYTPYYNEPFNANTQSPMYSYDRPGLPNCWTKASGGDLINGPSEYGTGRWMPNSVAAYGIVTNSEAITISFIGSDIKSWVLSPLFNLSEGQYECKVKIALDPGSKSLISMGSDDKVQLVYIQDGMDWQVLKTWSANDNLTTGYHTSIVSLDGITGENVRFAFLADEGIIQDNMIYKFHLDDLTIREKSSCLEPLNSFADGITNASAKLSWDNPSTATSWKVAVVPTGVTPTNEWETVFTNPHLASGLTANTTYDFYVKSVCGGIESEVIAEPFTFQTRCSPIVAPYTETFVEYYEIPECWMLNPEGLDIGLFTVLYWNFTTEAKFDAAEAGDHTQGGETQYAWINTATLNNKERASLSSPIVDVSGLENPALQFYVFSKNMIDNALNHLLVEVYNGSEWVEATRIENYTNNWAPYTIDLASLGAIEIIEARFTLIADATGGNTGYNNILIDDVAFIEMPQCPTPFNLIVTEVTDTTAKVVWENTGITASWEIEYGPKGFVPGEGTIVTVNTTPELILTDLDDNQEYEVYIKSLCNDEIVGPQIFITETTSGINDSEKIKVVLYPNPVTGVLNLESDTTIDGVEVYNIVGQLVKKQSFNSNFASVFVNELSEGIYMVKVFSGKNVATYKVIKKQ